MPIDTEETLLRWVEAIQDEMLEKDRRITRLETTLKVVWALLGLLVAAGGVIVALLAHLKNVA